MSEVAEDLVVEGSEETPSEEQVTPIVGADMLPEPAEPSPEDSEPSEAEPETSESEDFDIDKVDLLSIDTQRLPDEYRPMQKYLRRFQSEMDRSRNQWEQERKDAQEARKEYLGAIQKLSETRSPESSPQDPFDQLDLTPQERAGLKALEEKFLGNVKPVEEKVQELDSKLSQVDQLIKKLDGFVQTQQNQSVENEITQLREKYPDANLQDERVVALFGRTNPETGKKISLLEAYELVSGRKAEEAASLRVKDALLRNGAKKRASSQSSTPADGNAPLSMTEGLSTLHNLGFDR